eukprot:CAMPEP_0194038554 /NCGR_PEP_ID=MMETSP0009_2-20130614/10779_1 /TAXON_ID=210454 /ORGANISM="Grammatophora oceanica, Strain CCMP 410" /LENGTH=546 /DNA_ID=CAMNT_0038681091 /DNA_START=1 /DNA_END=1641 /DNA_ORIENTATION=+
MDAPDDLLSCQELDVLLSQLPDAACPEQDAVATLSHICGCSDLEIPTTCNGICPEGIPTIAEATPFGPLIDNFGALLADFEPFRFASCEFVDYAFQLQPAAECSAIQSLPAIAAPCGCTTGQQEDPQCGLCGIGSDLPDYTTLPGISEETQRWCQSVDATLSVTLSESECTSTLARDEYIGLQDTCGCNGFPTGAGVCAVCPGGLAPGLPDNEMFTVFGLTSADSSDTITCGASGSVLGIFTAVGDIPCEVFQAWGSLFCGCPTTDAGLRAFCPDGMASSAPDKPLPKHVEELVVTEFLGVDVGGVFAVNTEALDDGITCGEVGNLFSVAGNSSDFFETSLPFDCECPGYTELTCPFCSDGSMIDGSVDLDGFNFTCDLLQFEFGLANKTVCAAAVALEPYCGCPATPTSDAACRLCGAGVLLEEPSRYVSQFEASCSDIELDVNYLISADPTNASICPEAQNLVGPGCCGSTDTPTVAPDDGTEAPTASPPGGGTTPTTATPSGEPADPTGAPTDPPASKATPFFVSIVVSLLVTIVSFAYQYVC